MHNKNKRKINIVKKEKTETIHGRDVDAFVD